jgi:hypothetical protein
MQTKPIRVLRREYKLDDARLTRAHSDGGDQSSEIDDAVALVEASNRLGAKAYYLAFNAIKLTLDGGRVETWPAWAGAVAV